VVYSAGEEAAAAETIDDVVNFYDVIFDAHLSSQDRQDLAAFLGAL
jgi:hypothetical protein